MLTPISDKEMKTLTSMKTGGKAREVYFPESVKELAFIVKELRENNEKYVILGNMSNVLLPDETINAALVVTTEMKSVKILDGGKIYAEAGVSLTKLALDTCKAGLSGLEFAYGIPGSVGGAVYMNAGAYGGEVKDVITAVYALDSQGNEITLTNKQCEFEYRKSVFSKNGFVILGAEFSLTGANAVECVKTAKEFMQRRIDKQPLDYPSCGSTFKRPEGYFAGALIEEAGLRGFEMNGAAVSEKHAGFVINKNGAGTNEVLALMRYVREKVKENSGVTLEEEIKLLGTDGEFFRL